MSRRSPPRRLAHSSIMRPIVQFFFLAALASAATVTDTDVPQKWTSLHAKWSMFSWFSHQFSSAFFELPMSTTKAKKEKWVQADSDDITTTWCMKNDPRVCVLFDQQGSVAGVQVGIPAKDLEFEGNPYPISKHPYFNKMTLFDTPIYAGRYYLVDQDTLKAGGRTSPSKLGNGLWLKSGDDLVNVPLTASLLESNTKWTREKCIPMMGRHYYYNVTPEAKCEDAEPYFLLVDNDKDYVHGIGFQTFGKASKLKRNWFESVPSSAVKTTIPNSPQCLTDWVEDYGLISLHMYFVDSPWFIMC